MKHSKSYSNRIFIMFIHSLYCHKTIRNRLNCHCSMLMAGEDARLQCHLQLFRQTDIWGEGTDTYIWYMLSDRRLTKIIWSTQNILLWQNIPQYAVCLKIIIDVNSLWPCYTINSNGSALTCYTDNCIKSQISLHHEYRLCSLCEPTIWKFIVLMSQRQTYWRIRDKF